MLTNQNIKEIEISAKITRANGQVEDLGVISKMLNKREGLFKRIKKFLRRISRAIRS